MLLAESYGGDAVRQDHLLSGIVPVISPGANRKNPPPCDFRACKHRNRAEVRGYDPRWIALWQTTFTFSNALSMPSEQELSRASWQGCRPVGIAGRLHG